MLNKYRILKADMYRIWSIFIDNQSLSLQNVHQIIIFLLNILILILIFVLEPYPAWYTSILYIIIIYIVALPNHLYPKVMKSNNYCFSSLLKDAYKTTKLEQINTRNIVYIQRCILKVIIYQIKIIKLMYKLATFI